MVKIKRQLGKNAAYATIAADLLEQGESPAMDSLWPGVRDRYKKHTGEEAAEYEQGQIKLVAALFREHQLRTQPGRA
ncbi:MAG TPA: hypothetical protein VJ739_06580 [Gemmataceae bacterium]|nr:hypothetical protein [Gemmataceae bacterium]